MKKLLLLILVMGLPTVAFAQNPVPAIPDRVDVLVIAPGADPVTAAPVGTRSTVIGATSPNCNITALPTPGPTPLVNPTRVFFNDPFNNARFCQADMPTGLQNNTGYQAVAVFFAPSCTVNSVTVTPCPSARSTVGIPPFNIQPVLTPPVPPTNLVVRQ